MLVNIHRVIFSSRSDINHKHLTPPDTPSSHPPQRLIIHTYGNLQNQQYSRPYVSVAISGMDNPNPEYTSGTEGYITQRAGGGHTRSGYRSGELRGRSLGRVGRWKDLEHLI